MLPLYGELAPGEQDAALAPARAGRRKVVLATNIAETSLTIDGVRVVVDAGLERRSVFDPVSGMSRLETQRISRASAEQRAGRAGRTAPGVCYRLWSESAERSLAAYAAPEIAVADLAPLALDLAAWGTAAEELALARRAAGRDAGRRARPAACGSARSTRSGRITPHGRAMQSAGRASAARAHAAHGARASARRRPRRSSRRCCRSATCCAARDRERDSDIRTRLETLQRGGGDRGVLERVRRTERAYLRELGAGDDARADAADAGLAARVRVSPIASASAGPATAAAISSRTAAARRSRARKSIAREELIVAVELDDRERDAQIQLAAPLARGDSARALRGRARRRATRSRGTRARKPSSRGARCASASSCSTRSRCTSCRPARADAALLEGLRSLGLDALPWDDDSRTFAARCEFVRKLGRGDVGDWPDFSPAALAADLAWLEPYLDGVTRRAHFARIPLARRAARSADAARSSARSTSSRRRTSRCRPARARPIDYVDDNAPCASMRMQEVFGLAATPRIGGGAVPVTFKLLSPAHRPLQVTRDLASFWRNAYVEVRKDMRGRYPRHYWPENPLEAEPTRRAKPRPRRGRRLSVAAASACRRGTRIAASRS